MSTLLCDFTEANTARKSKLACFYPLDKPEVDGDLVILKDPVKLKTGTDGRGTITLEQGLYDLRVEDNPPIRISVPNDSLTYDLAELVEPSAIEPSYGTIRVHGIQMFVESTGQYHQITLQLVQGQIILQIEQTPAIDVANGIIRLDSIRLWVEATQRYHEIQLVSSQGIVTMSIEQ